MCRVRSFEYNSDVTVAEHKLDMLDMLLETHLNLASSDIYGGSVIYNNNRDAVDAVLLDITGNLADMWEIYDIWLDCNESGRYCIELYMQRQMWASQGAGHESHQDDTDYLESCVMCREEAIYEYHREMAVEARIGRSSSDW